MVEYNGWSNREYSKYIDDMIEYMKNCKSDKCIYRGECGCIKKHIDLEYALGAGVLAVLHDKYPEIYNNKDFIDFLYLNFGDKCCCTYISKYSLVI